MNAFTATVFLYLAGVFKLKKRSLLLTREILLFTVVFPYCPKKWMPLNLAEKNACSRSSVGLTKENKTVKDSGRSSKITLSPKWPIESYSKWILVIERFSYDVEITLRFPAKENPKMEKALFDWPTLLRYDVKVKLRLISRKFSGKFFSPERSLNQPKATRVCIRSINQSTRFISLRLLFLFCSRVFMSRSYENHSITACNVGNPANVTLSVLTY